MPPLPENPPDDRALSAPASHDLERVGVLEGGIRTPDLVQWKAALPAGKIFERPVSSLDISATALAAAVGRRANDLPLDGVDLAPFFTGRRRVESHAALYRRMQARNIWAKTLPEPLWSTDTSPEATQARQKRAQRSKPITAETPKQP